jgi:hypothetical protein
MRRPLDWFVVSLSLLVLFANRMWAEQPAQPRSVPLAQAPRPTPFAYVREDGSELYLQASGSAVPAPRVPDSRLPKSTGNFNAAVYTWSSPVLAQERPAFR